MKINLCGQEINMTLKNHNTMISLRLSSKILTILSPGVTSKLKEMFNLNPSSSFQKELTSINSIISMRKNLKLNCMSEEF